MLNTKNPVDSLFLELLRAAIWNMSVDETSFYYLDSSVWQEILKLSKSQRVCALLYDGIMTLPKSARPEKGLLYKLFLQTQAIEQLNIKINKSLKNLAYEYEKIGCQFVLLKGQGNALVYPKPNHRSPGDIDVYLYRKEDYEKANYWAVSRGYKIGVEHVHHKSFEFEDISIENHRKVSYFLIKKYDSLLEKEIQQITEEKLFAELKIDDLIVKVLPAEFNAFFIFYHLFLHFIKVGVGVRQFCDWILFMDKYSEQMNQKELLRLLKSFDLLKPAKIFASVAVKHLGANPSIFPFETNIHGKCVRMILEDILSGGNFGFLRSIKRTYNIWPDRWNSFTFTIKRTIKIAKISPNHILIMPYLKLLTRIKLFLNEILGINVF